MGIKEYADVLKLAIKLQIEFEEEMLENCGAMHEDHYNGVITGLMIALEKIDKSMFLAK